MCLWQVGIKEAKSNLQFLKAFKNYGWIIKLLRHCSYLLSLLSTSLAEVLFIWTEGNVAGRQVSGVSGSTVNAARE